MGRVDSGKLLVTSVLLRIVILAAIGTAAVVIAVEAQGRNGPWERAWVTGYSTRENLTGCYAPGKYPWQQRLCRTACGVNLDDRKYWVAANPRHGLGCGQIIQVCAGVGGAGGGGRSCSPSIPTSTCMRRSSCSSRDARPRSRS